MTDYRGFRIKEIHAICGIGEDDEEGIPAMMTSEGPLPLISSDGVRLEQLKDMAQIIADKTGQAYKVVKFTNREDVGEIIPRKAKQ